MYAISEGEKYDQMLILLIIDIEIALPCMPCVFQSPYTRTTRTTKRN